MLRRNVASCGLFTNEAYSFFDVTLGLVAGGGGEGRLNVKSVRYMIYSILVRYNTFPGVVIYQYIDLRLHNDCTCLSTFARNLGLERATRYLDNDHKSEAARAIRTPRRRVTNHPKQKYVHNLYEDPA